MRWLGARYVEGGALMTGIGAWALGVASQNERFHPNASGHAKIAQTIIDANVYQSDDYVPARGRLRAVNWRVGGAEDRIVARRGYDEAVWAYD